LFRARPIHTVIAGPTLWELEKAPEILQWYREFILKAPEDLSGFFAFLVVPPAPPFPEELHGKKMCGVVWCYLGPPAKAEKVFAPIRRAHPAALDLVGPMPFPMLTSMFDALYPPGLQWYWKADFVRQLPDEAIREHVRFGKMIPTMWSTMHLYPINGATRRVRKDATAWAYRDANWAEVIVGVDRVPANKQRIVSWARSYWEALHPYSAGGAYVNFMMEEGEDRVKATYGGNYARLARIKAKYDPENLFHINQNIKPAARAGKKR
ncbi:MAG TPA: BBE domain-containing protein, partial [Terriglobales bacterium]|nr:BBE domain-containing protein [Terriglobales bacterium]